MRPTIVSNVAFTPAASETSHGAASALPPAAVIAAAVSSAACAVEIEHDDVRALGAEERRNRPSDAGAAAGDDGDFSAEIKHDVAGVEVLHFAVRVNDLLFTLSVK